MEFLSGTSDTVYTERGRIYTKSRDPGKRVYGERLVGVNGTEYREWSPRRSKLCAYLSVGGRAYPLRKDSKVLYLGAASGTTVSHVSDIASEGMVYSVEFSPRSFRDLVAMSPRGTTSAPYWRTPPVRTSTPSRSTTRTSSTPTSPRRTRRTYSPTT